MAAEQRLRSVNFWSGVVVLCLTIAGALVGIYQLNEVLTDEQQVPLAELSVQGELQYTASEEVRQALTAEPLGSFFTADVDDLRRRVEQLPWVQKVSIRKVWPDKLSVYVTEHKPVAMWNGDRLINQHQEVGQNLSYKHFGAFSTHQDHDISREARKLYLFVGAIRDL